MIGSLTAASLALVRAALELLAGFFAGNPSREQTHVFMRALTAQYGQAAAAAAATYYDDARAAAGVRGGFRAIVAEPAPDEQVRKSTDWALRTPVVARETESDADEPKPDVAEAAQAKLAGVAQRLILAPARKTVMDSILKDPAKPKYARVPEPDACGFCLMLSSRGAVYLTEKTASFDAHDFCQCDPEVVFDGQEPSFDVDAIYEQYAKARQSAGSSDPKKIAAELDRDRKQRRGVPRQAATNRSGPATSGTGGGDGPIKPPSDRSLGVPDGDPLGQGGPQDWEKFLDHVWSQHAPGSGNPGETEYPAGFTRSDVDDLVREIGARPRVRAGDSEASSELLDSGQVTLEEIRANWTNLYAAKDGVRYEIRVAGKHSTAHPIDGDGIRRVNRKTGEQEAVPWGRRPVKGWPTEPRKA